jgi:gamma-glutamyltranspeptidase/glutathione hydrolase
MALAHQRGGKLPWAKLFEPAIRLARDGFAVTPRFNGALTRFAGPAMRACARSSTTKRASRSHAGAQSRAGGLLERIAERGPDSFYVGPQAAKLVATVNNAARNPSKMTVGDLAAYSAKERPVLCGTYRRHKICSMGPPSSGGVAVLMILKQLERFDMAKLGKDSPTPGISSPKARASLMPIATCISAIPIMSASRSRGCSTEIHRPAARR